MNPEETVTKLKAYFDRFSGVKKFVIGVSGGVDSAVALVLCCEAIGHANVLAVLSPGRHTSPESTEQAKLLCENLYVKYIEVPIEKEEDGFWQGVLPLKIDRLKEHYPEPSHVTIENMQSIDRMSILRAVANEEDGVIVGTGNRTEFYFGYFTLGGDGGADIFPLITWSKGDVYTYAKKQEAIPKFILERTPSAELAEGQVDPFDYKEADNFLQRFLDEKKTEEQLKEEFGEKTTKRYLKLINKNEHKRLRYNDLLQ